jgi:hypothetical protein
MEEIMKKMTISETLLRTAEIIGCAKTNEEGDGLATEKFICFAIRSAVNEQPLGGNPPRAWPFFCKLFMPPYEKPTSAWMTSEDATRQDDRNHRVLALLLAREIYLREK